MKLACWFGIIIVGAVTFVFAASKGIPPRPSANKYPAHAESNGAMVGAGRLSPSQLRKALAVDKITASDLDEASVVVEVGLYPAKDGTLGVSADGFALRVQGEDTAVKSSSAGTVVAKLPYWMQVDQSGGGSGAMVAPRPSVGSGTGGIYRDPVTGMPRRDGAAVRPNGTDVGVGVGGSNPSQPSGSPERRNLQLRMEEASLPQGNTSAPVAGYIYFSTENKKGAKYQLEYTLNGKKIALPL